jgi:hypothetical protein
MYQAGRSSILTSQKKPFCSFLLIARAFVDLKKATSMVEKNSRKVSHHLFPENGRRPQQTLSIRRARVDALDQSSIGRADFSPRKLVEHSSSE